MIKKLLSVITALFISSSVFSQTHNVTFQVANPTTTNVYVFGSWSGWSNWPGDLMTDANGDGIFDKTLALQSGNVEFLYVCVSPTDTTKEQLNPAWLCTNGNGQYTNRVLAIGSNDTTVCNNWASCTTCGQTPTPYVNVNFQLQSAPSSSMYVFGSWSGWSNWPGTLMNFNSASNLYEATISVQGDSTIEYLFVNGADTTKEILDPNAACTNGNGQFTNRKSSIAVADTMICAKWQTCESCIPTSIKEIKMSDIRISINSTSLRINTELYTRFNQVEVYNATGSLVYSELNGVAANTNVSASFQRNMIYFVRLKSNDRTFTFKTVSMN
jgi:hypothetical protein